MQLQSTDSITDTFISLLMDTRRFAVMERERIKDFTEEMFNKGQFNIKGADYVFLNNISTLDIKTYKKKIPIVNVIQKEAVVKVQVNVRVVSVKTSRVLFSAIGKAESRKKLTQGVLGLNVDNSKLLDNDMVNNTMQEALKDVIQKIIDNLFPLKIIAVKNNIVYLNRGKTVGLKRGDIFSVYIKGEQLVDPDTGLKLGAEETYIGSIRVIEALSKYSKAEIIKGKIDANSKGAICRKPLVKIEQKEKVKDEGSENKDESNW